MYQTPEVLNAAVHGQLKYREPGNYAFAAAETIVPLLDEEIMVASAHYVVAFAVENGGRPVALLGLSNRNLYLDASGNWTAPYIPAAIRRYPFIFGTDATDAEMLHLTIDRAAPHFSDEGEPLYVEDGAPSPVLSGAMAFLTAYQKGIHRTEFGHKELLDAGLIEPRYLTVESDGETRMIGGYGAIDQDKLKATPDDKLAAWARSGLLATVYAHWSSLRHLDALAAAELRPEASQ